MDANHPRDRDLPYIFHWIYDFPHPLKKVWNLITDTDYINRAAHIPPVSYKYNPMNTGGSTRLGEFTVLLCMKMKWIEHPYEWIENQFFRVEREYEKGPLKRMHVHWEIEPTGDGCRMVQTIACEPASKFFTPIVRIEVGRKTRKNFLKAYSHLDQYLSKKQPQPFRPTREDLYWRKHQNHKLLKDWLELLNHDPVLSLRISDYVFSSYPRDITRIRPFALAREIGMDQLDVLTTLLKGEKDKLFKLSWDVLCPSCRGAKASYDSPEKVGDTLHCDACNITSKVDFDKAVELTFAISPKMREVMVDDFCVGGPQNTPHYLAHLRIPANEGVSIELDLSEGAFIGRSLQADNRWRINVEEGGESKGVMDFGRGEQEDRELTLAPGEVELELQNTTDKEIAIIIEVADWLLDVCPPSSQLFLKAYGDLLVD